MSKSSTTFQSKERSWKYPKVCINGTSCNQHYRRYGNRCTPASHNGPNGAEQHKLITPPDILSRATYIATLSWLPSSAKAIPQTKLIQFFSAGTNHISEHPIYTDSKIPLCSANGVHGPQIAEWVIMMDLVHSHNFPQLYDLQKEKKWAQKEGMDVSDRVGKRVGILGYGSIGRQGECEISQIAHSSLLGSAARRLLHFANSPSSLFSTQMQPPLGKSDASILVQPL